MLVSSFKRVTQKELWIFLTTFIASSLVFAAIVAVIRQVKKPCCSFLKIRLLWWMFLNNSLTRSCVYHGSFLQNWKTVKGWGMNTKPPGWCTLGWCWSSLSLQSLSLGCGCYQPPCAPAPGSSANPCALLFRAAPLLLELTSSGMLTAQRCWGQWRALCLNELLISRSSSSSRTIAVRKNSTFCPREVKQSFFSMSKKFSVWFE